MKPTVQQVQNLLALKRHESPPEGYMEDFLREFHHRRVEEAVLGGSSVGLWGRLRAWFAEPGFARWAYGAGVAYAVFLAVVLMVPREVEVSPVASEPISPTTPSGCNSTVRWR